MRSSAAAAEPRYEIGAMAWMRFVACVETQFGVEGQGGNIREG
jgi:hypothetical protein